MSNRRRSQQLTSLHKLLNYAIIKHKNGSINKWGVMGINIRVLDSNNRWRSGERIGPHGTVEVLLAVLLAGYSVTGRSDARRVRRWIVECQTNGHDVPRRYPSTEMRLDKMTKSGMEEILAYRQGEVFNGVLIPLDNFVSIDVEAVKKNMALRQPSDRMVQVLCDCMLATPVNGEIHITGRQLELFAHAVGTLLPFISENAWYWNLKRYNEAHITHAMNIGGTLVFG